MAIISLSNPYISLNRMDKKITDPERPLTHEKISKIKITHIGYFKIMYGLLILCIITVNTVKYMNTEPGKKNCHYIVLNHDKDHNKLSHVMMTNVPQFLAKIHCISCKRTLRSMKNTSINNVFEYKMLNCIYQIKGTLRKMYHDIMNNINKPLNMRDMYGNMIMIIFYLFLNVKFDTEFIHTVCYEKCKKTYRSVPTGLYFNIPRYQIKIPFFDDSGHSKVFACLCTIFDSGTTWSNLSRSITGSHRHVHCACANCTSALDKNIRILWNFSQLNRQKRTNSLKNDLKRIPKGEPIGNYQHISIRAMRMVQKSTFCRDLFQIERVLGCQNSISSPHETYAKIYELHQHFPKWPAR